MGSGVRRSSGNRCGFIRRLLATRLTSAHAAVVLLVVIATIVAIGCGGPTAPTPPTLKVTSITPNAGSTTGGTKVTIAGTEFTSDATVAIGGVPATDVAVVSATTITAVAASRPTGGSSDVVVTAGGKTATLTAGFTYVAPTSANQPPAITSIRSIGSRPNQPADFADIGETITLVASISDNETPIDQLTLEWSGPGSFAGATATTMWQAPSSVAPAPSSVSLTLKAIERFTEGSVTHTQSSAPFTYTLQLHDSQKEILDMGEDFLTLFSNSNNSTSQVLHNFSTTCDGGRGYTEEKQDVDDNRNRYIEDFGAFEIQRRGPATINFKSFCSLPDGRFPQLNVDACASYAVHWEVNKKSSGAREVTNGQDYVSAVLENNEWRLCHSSFVATSGYPSLGLR